jgi:small-conductance mechanosensitive channel
MVQEVVQTAQSYLNIIIASVIILLVGFGLGVLAKKLIQRILKEIELNKIMCKVGITYNLEKFVSSIISYVIYLVTIVFFLDYLNIRSVAIYILLGAILALIVLTLLVGLKDVIPNFIGWVYLHKKSSKIKHGHHVSIKEISGKVERIGHLETEILTDRGDILYVPNALFLKSKYRLRKNKD